MSNGTNITTKTGKIECHEFVSVEHGADCITLSIHETRHGQHMSIQIKPYDARVIAEELNNRAAILIQEGNLV